MLDSMKSFFIVIILQLLCAVEGSPPEFPAKELTEVRALLIFYAHCGIAYKMISSILEKFHDLTLSANAIRKRLKRYGCPSRRGPTSLSQAQLQTVISNKLKLLPKTVGYRQLTNILKQEGYHVRRDVVMETLRQVDPQGVQFRLRRRLQRRTYYSLGPNYTWHIDGYDKLKPFGFPIHGCIDGYSRKLIWLQVGPSNNDPKQVAYHYMSAVKRLRGCPLSVQADKGTENTVIGALQCLFIEEPLNSGCRGFQHISSQLNQRIESWWSIYRRRSSQWWMEFFKDLVDSGHYERHKEYALKCMRYSFVPLIQKDLDDIAEQWNNHQISLARHGNCPNGRPNVLYALPSMTGGLDCLKLIEEDDITFGDSQTVRPTHSGDAEFDSFAESQCAKQNLMEPDTWQEALQRYFFLLQLSS